VAVSVLLHYVFLVAFCLMLTEAIQLLISTVFVFHVQTSSQTAALLVAAWSMCFSRFVAGLFVCTCSFNCVLLSSPFSVTFLLTELVLEISSLTAFHYILNNCS